METKVQKLGGSTTIRGASNFLDWKLRNILLDIPHQGVNYTWTNNRTKDEVIYERIDKAFCNPDWKDTFPEAKIWSLPILLSDHSPIILHLKPQHLNRLDAWSLSHEEVGEIISQEWSLIYEGSPSFILQRKLQNSLRKIRGWCLNFKNHHKID